MRKHVWEHNPLAPVDITPEPAELPTMLLAPDQQCRCQSTTLQQLGSHVG